MRRNLMLTVAAATTMVLLAMLVPMAVLLRSYVLEDRLAQAALEVQSAETVVSGGNEASMQDYVTRVNADADNQVTVILPRGTVIGPAPGADERNRIVGARTTGTARVDDVDGGSVILVPVSLGRSTAAGDETPVVRVFVPAPGWEADLVRSWAILGMLGLALLAAALVLADRLGRSFVRPIADLASYAARLGVDGRAAAPPADGPAEVRELGVALHRLVDRVEALLADERAGIADASHRLRTPMTALRLRVDGVADPSERDRLGDELDRLQATVDAIVQEARRAERGGLTGVVDGVDALTARVRWWAPLAEDLGRPFQLEVGATGPVAVRASTDDVAALVDVLLDNAFTHTPDDASVRVSIDVATGGGVRLVVEDAGPGLPDSGVLDRGVSGAGSTGLGLAIAARTATESGGTLTTGRSPDLGGARVEVVLGPG